MQSDRIRKLCRSSGTTQVSQPASESSPCLDLLGHKFTWFVHEFSVSVVTNLTARFTTPAGEARFTFVTGGARSTTPTGGPDPPHQLVGPDSPHQLGARFTTPTGGPDPPHQLVGPDSPHQLGARFTTPTVLLTRDKNRFLCGQTSECRFFCFFQPKNRVKKKYFVLRGESDNGEARLECYDVEKKFHNGGAPKDVIILKSCFNISKRSDAKHKFGIQLFARDEHFIIVCDLEVRIQLRVSAPSSVATKRTRKHVARGYNSPVKEGFTIIFENRSGIMSVDSSKMGELHQQATCTCYVCGALC